MAPDQIPVVLRLTEAAHAVAERRWNAAHTAATLAVELLRDIVKAEAAKKEVV